MIDMFAFLEISNGFNYAFWIGRVGKTGDYILEKIINTRSNGNNVSGRETTVPKESHYVGEELDEPSSSTIVEFDDYATVECEYDNENNLTKLTRKLRYDVLEKTTQLVVTQETVEVDGEMHYVAKTVELKTEKIDEGYDYDTYTLKY